MPNVFLFDIDGTLLNSSRAGRAAMEETLLLEFGLEDRDYNIATAGRTDRAIISDLLAHFNLDSQGNAFAQFQQRYFELLPGHLEKQHGFVLPGVENLLDLLAARLPASWKDRIGLLTGNFEQTGWMKVRHFKLDHHFSFGTFGDYHHQRDDVAREASASLKSRGGDNETVWIIGDTPADVQCAKAINAKSLAVATGIYSFQELNQANPDVLVDGLNNTEYLVDLLLK